MIVYGTREPLALALPRAECVCHIYTNAFLLGNVLADHSAPRSGCRGRVRLSQTGETEKEQFKARILLLPNARDLIFTRAEFGIREHCCQQMRIPTQQASQPLTTLQIRNMLKSTARVCVSASLPTNFGCTLKCLSWLFCTTNRVDNYKHGH